MELQRESEPLLRQRASDQAGRGGRAAAHAAVAVLHRGVAALAVADGPVWALCASLLLLVLPRGGDGVVEVGG